MALLARPGGGRTTVEMTSSLWLRAQAVGVIRLARGIAAARGTHKERLATGTAYKDTVVRGEATS